MSIPNLAASHSGLYVFIGARTPGFDDERFAMAPLERERELVVPGRTLTPTTARTSG